MFVATRYATKIQSSSNVSRYSICDSSRNRVQMLWGSIHWNGASLFTRRDRMDVGHFYYLNDQYFIDFPDPQLMQRNRLMDSYMTDRAFMHFKMITPDCIGWYRFHQGFLNLQVYIIKKYRNMANAIQLYLVMFLVIEKLFWFKICLLLPLNI